VCIASCARGGGGGGGGGGRRRRWERSGRGERRWQFFNLLAKKRQAEKFTMFRFKAFSASKKKLILL
jgi:hypothetical protein